MMSEAMSTPRLPSPPPSSGSIPEQRAAPLPLVLKAADRRPPGQLGAYRLDSLLARGGMAEVWQATDLRSGSPAVVKRLLPAHAGDPELARALVDEGRLGLRLRHTNVVRTLEAGDSRGIYFVALERLEGMSLYDLIVRGRLAGLALPLGAIVRIVVDAARGLHHAHGATDALGRPLGIIHRDVTPHNLFVCRDGTTKVIDFGIARDAFQMHRTRRGVVKGKLAYLAPEQIRLEPIDHRVDVFALGIVLHELLCERPLFRVENSDSAELPSDEETLRRILELDIPSPDEVRPQVPAGLAAITLRALWRPVERRLPTAAALGDALEAVAEVAQLDCSRAAVAALLASPSLPAPLPVAGPAPVPSPARTAPPAVAVPPAVAAHLIARLCAEQPTRVRRIATIRSGRRARWAPWALAALVAASVFLLGG